ncbi:hypothetical protein RHMOL_Rhmol07G0233700 [Rhododendron molle]|uniref:Uncharacterized protein n=1 Tax=Rhododendron molle TaxID=49168 RepID=A0ACC0N5J2_RHOML|nr:hypothetical protein RHMOL_Rhmol07G0233700 [Rhododendron molle]
MPGACCGGKCTCFVVAMTVLYCIFWAGDLLFGLALQAAELSDLEIRVIGSLSLFFGVGLIVLYFVALCKDRDGALASPRD